MQLQATAKDELCIISHGTTIDDERTRTTICSSFHIFIQSVSSSEYVWDNTGRVNRGGIFGMQIALITHFDVFVIDIVPATSCGMFNSNIESHHFPKCVWNAYSISRDVQPVVEDSTWILHSFFISCPVLSSLVLPDVILSHFTLSYPSSSYLILACLLWSYFILSYLVLSCLILPSLLFSDFILVYLFLSYFILSYFIFFYPILSYLVLSNHITSCLILSYLIFSYPILSHSISSHLISFHFTSSHLIWPDLLLYSFFLLEPSSPSIEMLISGLFQFWWFRSL
jgi:hypothetical protein